jgi:peptidyl-prolyl cis-trans isomerase D
MLQTIHDKISGWVAKVLLGALVIVFVFWGVELRSVSSTTSAAAEVNGDEISLSSLQSAWQQRQAQLAQAFKGQIPDAFKKQQQEQLLNQMIRSQLMIARTNDEGFRVSDTELVNQLNSLDSLKVDGKFSRDKYAAALLQQGMTEAQFESQLRTDLETRQLQNGVVGTAFITPAELLRARALLGEQREVDYVVAPLKSFEGKVQVSDKDVQAWYDAHKSEYMTDESVELQYVELKLADVAATVQVDDAALREHYEQIKDRFTGTERRRAHHILITTDKNTDDTAAKKLAEELLAKIKAGGDFEALAKQYSKDPGSAAKGGDLGWATRGMFVGPFEDALFAMKPGEIVGPIKTEFGYHIIRLDEAEGGGTKPFEQVRAEVAADYKSERAATAFYDQTQKLADEAFAKLTELDSVAKTFNTKVNVIKDFTRKGAGEFVGNSSVIEAAFSTNVLDKGENSPLVTLGEDRALVLRVADHKAPEQKPLEQVKADIVTKLTAQSAKAELAKQASETLKQLQAGTLQWANVSKSLPGTPAGKKLVGRTAEGVDSAVLKAAFGVAKSSVSVATPAYQIAPLASGDYALVMVTDVKQGGTDNAAELKTLREQRISKLGSNELSAYVGELERTAKIVRNPKVFE